MISTPLKETINIDWVYKRLLVIIKEYETLIDLLPLELKGFDMILGMNWLSVHVELYDFGDDYKEVIKERVYGLFNLYFGGRKEEDGGIKYSFS